MRRYYIDFINNKVVEDEQGYYVSHDDVESIIAENERLKNVVKSQKDLIALNNKDATKFREENERLKASIKVMHTECDTCWKIEELRKENDRLKAELREVQ